MVNVHFLYLLATDILPTTLSISKERGEIIIYPNVADTISGINYQQAGGSVMTFTQPIKINTTETITFFHCQNNATFIIGKIMI